MDMLKHQESSETNMLDLSWALVHSDVASLKETFNLWTWTI